MIISLEVRHTLKKTCVHDMARNLSFFVLELVTSARTSTKWHKSLFCLPMKMHWRCRMTVSACTEFFADPSTDQSKQIEQRGSDCKTCTESVCVLLKFREKLRLTCQRNVVQWGSDRKTFIEVGSRLLTFWMRFVPAIHFIIWLRSVSARHTSAFFCDEGTEEWIEKWRFK